MPGAAVPGARPGELRLQLHVTRRRGERGGPRKVLAQCRLNADPKVLLFWGVDGEEQCAGANRSTLRAVLRDLRVSA